MMDYAGYLSREEVIELSEKEDEEERLRIEEFKKRYPPKKFDIGLETNDLFRIINQPATNYKGSLLTDADKASVINHLDFLFRNRKK
ncbi:hypothetical protein D3C86_1124290 [compost metagenome]